MGNDLFGQSDQPPQLLSTSICNLSNLPLQAPRSYSSLLRVFPLHSYTTEDANISNTASIVDCLFFRALPHTLVVPVLDTPPDLFRNGLFDFLATFCSALCQFRSAFIGCVGVRAAFRPLLNLALVVRALVGDNTIPARIHSYPHLETSRSRAPWSCAFSECLEFSLNGAISDIVN